MMQYRMPSVWMPEYWLMAVMLPVLVFTSTASAHERRDVGPYQCIVGFVTEPVFEGLKNGVDLRVIHTETQKPVEGLEHTLQVEITHVPSGVARVLRLRTIYRDPAATRPTSYRPHRVSTASVSLAAWRRQRSTKRSCRAQVVDNSTTSIPL